MTLETQNGQTKVDILTRHGIPLDLGERQFRVRPRTMANDYKWVETVFARVTDRIVAFGKKDADGDAAFEIADVIAALSNSTTDMLDLILAYDETQQLPPREWVEENAITSQITTAFTTLLEVAYPPFAVSRRLLPADQAAAVIGSLLNVVIRQTVKDMSSGLTDSPSPNGVTELPKKSTKPSRRASSRS